VIDLGVSKLALIGAVALLVIGPEKLPQVARTIGLWIGRVQRYVAEVKSEVDRSMELDALKKMRETVEGAANEVSQSLHSQSAELKEIWSESSASQADSRPDYPIYKRPHKKWRVKQKATPNWYKARNGVRTKALSGAARVAKHRPQRMK
jgi:sec-independent protein translocase protein TatB